MERSEIGSNDGRRNDDRRSEIGSQHFCVGQFCLMNWCLERPKQSVLAGSTFTEVVEVARAEQVLGKVAEAAVPVMTAVAEVEERVLVEVAEANQR